MKQKTLIEIDEILFEYDGPYLFTGTDEQNNKYLNIQCNIDKNIVYLSVPISQQEIIDIKLASRSSPNFNELNFKSDSFLSSNPLFARILNSET